MKISTLYTLFQECSGVTTDSRKIVPDILYIALRGEKFNGNEFAAEALRTGALYAVIDDPAYDQPENDKIILVEDSLKTLQELASYHRKALGTTIIGITGTNGKTTTKELIAAVLSGSYRVLYTQGNLYNHIGVPLTLLQLTPQHQLAVIEMGASHPGEIRTLADIADPDCGLITNVGKAHLEGFSSFEGVIRTKGELYEYLREKKGSTVFIHHENSYLMDRAQRLNAIYYGTEEDLYVNGRITGSSPYLSFEWKAGREGAHHPRETRLIGAYNFENALAAITIGRYFDVEPHKINEALSGYTPTNNRSQLTETVKNKLILDAYNANPTSMKAALTNFKIMNAPRKMVILGDMKELGEDSHEEHQKIVSLLEDSQFERVILVGGNFCQTENSYECYNTTEKTLRALETASPEGYLILIKGSNSMHLTQVTNHL
ncbi:MAG: UDP-N-acetylmuramoyl-tripeptide--D-alanyl-D-alanine ligase [Bacteroides sp.]|nr:UDP-N-acetylmuramoyl-tripeptide--D-alanyl-D-alanine ligase [Bacteroides sp.]